MKVAIVSFGHADVILPLFKRLLDSTFDVHLYFCFSMNRKSESVLDFSRIAISTGFTKTEKTEELLGTEINNYLGKSKKVQFFIYHNQKLRSARNIFLSFKLAERLKQYDIIHFNGINGVLPVLIYLLNKKKLIFSIHDVRSHSGERTKFNFGEKLIAFIIKSNYLVIVHNLSDFRKLFDNNPFKKDNFHFLPFGELEVYREFKSDSVEPVSSDLLFFGRISPYKGLNYLIDALKLLKSENLRIKTVIAGGGEICFQNEGLSDLGILIMNKHIPNNELVSLIEHTKIVVCPYTDATQSGVVMTAFAFNKPVLASNAGNFPEVIKDGTTGALISPLTADEMAKKLKLLLGRKDLLDQMSINIKKFKNDSEYSWDTISQRTLALYASAAK